METLQITNTKEKLANSSYSETTQVIGLFGFGTVGSGLYHVLENSPTTKARIKKVCIKNAFKERSLSRQTFHYKPRRYSRRLRNQPCG